MKMCGSRKSREDKGDGFRTTHEDSFPMGKQSLEGKTLYET